MSSISGLQTTIELLPLGQLILSIDIGTSQSAVAVLYSRPGVETYVTQVARWPGQEGSMYEEKVPSMIMYDDKGNPLRYGAEAASRDAELDAEDNGHHCVENFKMHLHTTSLLEKSKQVARRLPPGVDVLKVYTHFLSFLLRETRRHLRDETGVDPWPELESKAQIVMSHPNSWGSIQQRLLQKAAVASGLVHEKGLSRLSFVEEGESAATFCMSTQEAVASSLAVGDRFIVCDAGGSTADISAYRVKARDAGSMSLEELDTPSCQEAGGARVDHIFASHLFDMLTWAREEGPEEIPGYVADGLRDFRRTGKRRFSDVASACNVQIGTRGMKSSVLPIVKGVMAVSGVVAASFFRASIDDIVKVIQTRLGKANFKYIILTGGFGESPFLKSELQKAFDKQCTIVLANPPNSKAVAMGALKLMTEGPGRVSIDRTKRPWKTWLKDLVAAPLRVITRWL